MKHKFENVLRSMFDLSYIAQGRGGLGSLVSWLIRVVIYDI